MTTFRGKPFWAWSGKLDPQEIVRQVKTFKEMGYGGFYIHSRVNLETEYLGDEWMQCVKAAISEAKKYGLEVWIYDEDRWPSGIAGGKVTMNPNFRQKYLYMRRYKKSGFQAIDYGIEYINSFAVKFEADRLADYYQTVDCNEIKDGYEILIFCYAEPYAGGFYNGYTYLDTLNKKATEKFLTVTHERYKEALKEDFDYVKGFFTDEPNRGTLLTGFNIGHPDKMTMLPYTYSLFDDFYRRCGYDLTERLPELYYLKRGEEFNKVAYDYVNVLQEMFRENFMRPYADWCHANGKMLVGHLMHEDSLTIQTTLLGSAIRCVDLMDFAGFDHLKSSNENYWIAKQAHSLRRQLGKERTLCEQFGCTGWHASFFDYKKIGDVLALLGVDERAEHLAWYTMKGESKRDFPAPLSRQSVWKDEWHILEEYYERIAEYSAAGKEFCDTLVIYPVESVWGRVHAGWAKDFEAKDAETKRLDRKYEELFLWLMDGGVAFDYGDEAILEEYAKVKGNIVEVGQCRYCTVVVSGVNVLRRSTLELLKNFVGNGGRVIVAGELPSYVNGEKTNENYDGFIKINGGEEEVVSLLSVDKCKVAGGRIWRRITETESGGNIFLLNPDDGEKETTIFLEGEKQVYESDLRSGEQKPLPYAYVDGNTVLRYTFAARGELMLVYANVRGSASEISVDTEGFERVFESDGYPYRLSEQNKLPLDIAEVYVNGSYYCRGELLSVDKRIRRDNGLEIRSSVMFQPWYKKLYKRRSDKIVAVKLVFEFEAEGLPADTVALISEYEQATYVLNGVNQTAKMHDCPIDCCFKELPLKGVKNGLNVLEIYTAVDEENGLENVYLSGDFAVKTKNGKGTLYPLSKKLDTLHPTLHGFPFYGGKIYYDTGLKGTLAVDLKEVNCGLVKIFDGEEEVADLIAPPYRFGCREFKKGLTVCAVINRRNTFGPLHLFPKTDDGYSYGPESYMDDFANFDENEYSIFDFGFRLVVKSKK